jgi:hypothetical protein
LNASHSELLQNFGWLLFDEEEEFSSFTKLNVIKSCRVEKSEIIYEAILVGINQALVNEKFRVAEYDFNFNEVYLYNKKRNYYIQDKLSTFVIRNFDLAYLREQKIIQALVEELFQSKITMLASGFNAIKNRRNQQGVGNLFSI